MDEAVAECVAEQIALGLDVINDGEIAKTGYATYMQDRLSGFSGDSPSLRFADLSDFPDYRRQMGQAAGTRRLARPRCTGPVAMVDRAPLDADIARLKAATETAGAEEVFMNAASPGVIAVFQINDFYADDNAYTDALATAMKEEYEAVIEAGFVLQLAVLASQLFGTAVAHGLRAGVVAHEIRIGRGHVQQPELRTERARLLRGHVDHARRHFREIDCSQDLLHEPSCGT